MHRIKISQNLISAKKTLSQRYRASNLLQRMAKVSLKILRLNSRLQCLTIGLFISFVLKSFIKDRLTTKSNELMMDLFKGLASNPYNNIGTHLLGTRCRMTSFLTGVAENLDGHVYSRQVAYAIITTHQHVIDEWILLRNMNELLQKMQSISTIEAIGAKCKYGINSLMTIVVPNVLCEKVR